MQVEVERNLTIILASSFTYRDHLDRGRPTRPALQQQQQQQPLPPLPQAHLTWKALFPASSGHGPLLRDRIDRM